MIQHGAEKIINNSQRYVVLNIHMNGLTGSMLIDDDIDEIIKRGEEKTAEINSKYAGLDLDALNNFKSESMVQTWEGEEFSGKVSPLSEQLKQRLELALMNSTRRLCFGLNLLNVNAKEITRLTNIIEII